MARYTDGGGSSGMGYGLGQIGSAINSIGAAAAKQAKPKKKASSGGGSSNRNSGGGGGARRSSGGGNYSPQPSVHYQSPPRPAVGTTSKGTVSPSVPAPTPKPISLDDWLAKDTAFQSSKSNYQRALDDYMAQMQAEQGKYNNEYTSGLNKLNVEKGDAQTALNDDYASRGLLNSGLYATALNDFQQNYATKQGDMERAKSAYFNDLNTDKTNFQTQQSLELDKAKQAAAARRAAQFGL